MPIPGPAWAVVGLAEEEAIPASGILAGNLQEGTRSMTLKGGIELVCETVPEVMAVDTSTACPV